MWQKQTEPGHQRRRRQLATMLGIIALIWQMIGGASPALSMSLSMLAAASPPAGYAVVSGPVEQSSTPTPTPTRSFAAGAAKNAVNNIFGNTADADDDTSQNDATQDDAKIAEGDLVVDLGFRPDPHGLPFENYADGYDNLTSTEMVRLFGDGVCAAQRGDRCLLSPPARQWMERYNQAMSGGGHCFGFSVLSLLIYADAVDPLLFNAANPSELTLAGNVNLQREIAYAWSFQALQSVRDQAVTGAPSDILDALIDYLEDPDPGEETYTLAFVNRRGRGGHAVTPYAVEDLGNDQFAVHIYDNNLPGVERWLLIDRHAETWSYVASVNPNSRAARYDGDAETRSLYLFPTTPGLGVQPCPFCAQTDGATDADEADGSFGLFNQLYLNADGDALSQLILTDGEGRQYGLVDGELVAEIPGVAQFPLFTADLWNDTQPPVINVPVGVNFSVRIDGSDLDEAETADLVMIGPGYTMGVRDVVVDPDGDPSVLFPAADGTSLRFEGGQDSAPTFFLGIETDGADYEFQLDGLDLAEGSAFRLDLDADSGRISVDLDDADVAADYDLELRRIDEDGESIFSHADLTFDPDSVLYLDYGDWDGDDDLRYEIDIDGDGEIDIEESLLDESIQFCDEDGCFDEYGEPIAERLIECQDDGVCYDEFGDPIEVECDADGLCFGGDGRLINAVFVECDADGVCYDEDGFPIEDSVLDCDEDGVCYDEDGFPIEDSVLDCDEDGVCYDADGFPIEDSVLDCDEDGVCYDEDGFPIEDSVLDCDEDGVCYDEESGDEFDGANDGEEELDGDFSDEDFNSEDEVLDDGNSEEFTEDTFPDTEYEDEYADEDAGDTYLEEDNADADMVDPNPEEEFLEEEDFDPAPEEDFFEDEGDGSG
ncbi:MAG: hypothetical protein R2856_12570 [Caldilineaceae bacterium]